MTQPKTNINDTLVNIFMASKKIEMIQGESLAQYKRRMECPCCDSEGFVDETIMYSGHNIIPGGMIEESGRKIPCPECQIEYYENKNNQHE